ncbi:hypothetical protein CDG60_08410 [Acinetobacter chinensis]|uniref:Uncharacterized protein n=1 Tax=Acinetobacter chinensis TaxID=2004650 RepID=A0A3B7LV09_9GAMM|nr:hypothetical protein [Acinetobacter chinensis]AXY56586.1 hypothetical protein CDG60_08410 [Acinetobacter chinensis]
MKSWAKFIFIPLISYSLFSIITTLFGFQPSIDSITSILVLLFSLIALIIILPYAMLRLAPKAPYLATFCYMSVLWGIFCAVRYYFLQQSFVQDMQPFIWSGLVIMLLAMGFYFFFQDPRFKTQYRRE